MDAPGTCRNRSCPPRRRPRRRPRLTLRRNTLSMTVNSTRTGDPADRPQTGSPVTNPNAALDKDGFLKLFIAQLQHQDPIQPDGLRRSMQQMSSFSMVEQITNMAATNTTDRHSSLNTSSAVGLIGRTVTYIDADKQLADRQGRERRHDQGRRRRPSPSPAIDRHRPVHHHRSRLIRRSTNRSIALMMRGMFAAISGLKQHQVMLDVTANDIANVNTIGYKSLARHVPGLADPAAARRRRPDDRQRRLERRPGRSRRRPRLDRQPDDRRRGPDDRQPARRRASRATASSRSATARPTDRDRADRADGLHARRQLLDQHRGLPDHADRPVRPRLRQPTRRQPDRASRSRSRPAPPASRSTSPAACPTSTRRTRHARHRRTASRSRRSRTRPASSARAATAGSPRPTPAPPDRQHAGRRRPGHHARRRGRDVQRGPRRRRSRT